MWACQMTSGKCLLWCAVTVGFINRSNKTFYAVWIGYADLVLNGKSETYLKTVTEYKPVD